MHPLTGHYVALDIWDVFDALYKSTFSYLLTYWLTTGCIAKWHIGKVAINRSETDWPVYGILVSFELTVWGRTAADQPGTTRVPGVRCRRPVRHGAGGATCPDRRRIGGWVVRWTGVVHGAWTETVVLRRRLQVVVVLDTS